MLKDIIGIHNLSEKQEFEIMNRIEKVICPDMEIDCSFTPKKEERVYQKELKYSPPIKKLVDEHLIIKSFLGFVPGICESIASKPEIDRQLILDSVNFIRSYADKFHHAKEEDILFKYVDESLDIIKVMLEDHVTGRGYVRCIIEGLEKNDKAAIIKGMNNYKELLTQHIKKEDEILYPWIDRALSITQVGELYRKFNDADEITGRHVPEIYEAFVGSLGKNN